MSATTALPQLLQIPITDLPIRVKKEVFPIFKQTLTPETHIAIGVSSGCDSMTLICLLLLYYQQQKRDLKYLHILHCNHKIRKQSEIEADYLTKFFSSIDLQIFERSSNLLTTEKALREWRYSCFRQACEEFPLPKENAPERGKGFQTALLFLGHHLEDRIESTFLNCIRGAGLKGFLNMQILQPHPLLDNEGNVCRPLLNITKNQILAFCEQFHIQYFEDESNKNLETSQRNFLRHEILEKLTNMNNGNSNFLESMKNIYQQMETLEDSPYWGGRATWSPVLDPSERLVGQRRGFEKKSSKTANNSQDIFHPIPTSPSRNAQYAYTTLSRDILTIRNTLGIATNLRASQIQERTKRVTQTQSGRKEFHGTYFFFHEKQLYIITPFHKGKNEDSPDWLGGKEGFGRNEDPSIKPFRTSHLPNSRLITKLWPQTIAGITIEAMEERFLGATLRFPKPWDHFAGKTRNRRCINQKIPLFWRNFIPLAVKDGKIIHMWKNVMNEKSNQN